MADSERRRRVTEGKLEYLRRPGPRVMVNTDDVSDRRRRASAAAGRGGPGRAAARATGRTVGPGPSASRAAKKLEVNETPY